MKQLRIFPSLLWVVLLATSALAQWQKQTINTDASFRGLCAVNAQVAWVSGTKGTFGRTVDGGQTWEVGTVPDATQLDFRDVEAFSATTAYLLSIGKGESSRIYKTIDGGKTWQLQFKNPDPDAFFDAFAFWGEKNGIAMSDPVKGQFKLVTTEDGVNWKPVWNPTIPAALPNEGGFAASGTCLFTFGFTNVWLVSGGAKVARVFSSNNRGRTWTVSETPIMANNESSGIFSIAFRDLNNGIIVGGDYRRTNETGSTAAITSDGGKTWRAIENKLPFTSGVVYANSKWFAVGPAGSFNSADNGATWQRLDGEDYNAVSFTKAGVGWAAGPKGRIAKYNP